MVTAATVTESATSADELKFAWVSAAKAIYEFRRGNHALEALRKGHGLLTADAFVEALWTRDIEIIAFTNDCAALVTWGECEHGKTLSVLTVAGALDRCIDAWPVLERAAKAADAKVIMSVGELAWKRIAEKQGYETRVKMFMRKVL